MAQWKQAPAPPEVEEEVEAEAEPTGLDALPEFPDLGYMTVMGMEVSSAAVLLPAAIVALVLTFAYARWKQGRGRR